jgi:hypothetical protein
MRGNTRHHEIRGNVGAPTFFLILLLHLRVAFGRQHPDLATLQTEAFEK